MREFTVKCEKPYKGEVVIEVVRYKDRLRYIKECNFKIDSTGNVEIGGDQIESFIKMIELAEKHVKKVDVKHGDIHATSFDEMQDYLEFDNLVSLVASAVLNGGSVGKS